MKIGILGDNDNQMSILTLKLKMKIISFSFFQAINDHFPSNFFLNSLFFSMLKCGQAPILNLLGSQKGISIYNVKLFLGIIKRRTNQVINNLSCVDQPSKILGKRDRIPKFNIKDMSSAK